MNDILEKNIDELRIEVAMLRERCAQLEIRLAKASEYPKLPPYTPPQVPPVVPYTSPQVQPCTPPPIFTRPNTGTGSPQTLNPQFTLTMSAEGDSNAG